MKLAVLSDFHIGASEESCGFRHRSHSFLRFLDDIEASHDRVVLLGDIYQCEQGRSLTHATMREQLHRARERTAWLSQRIEAHGYDYVHGNHDAISKNELGARTELVIEDGECRVFMTHGDRFDPILRRAEGLARMSTWFSGRLRQTPLRRLSDALEHADIRVKNRRFGGSEGPYASGARELATNHLANIVVMGHTHVARRHNLDGVIFANSGTCSQGARSWVSIDTRAGTADVHSRPRDL